VQSPPRALQDQTFGGPIDSYAVTLCPMSALPTPLQSALTKNAAANPLERAVAKSLDLKFPEINTCGKCGGSPLPFSTFSPLPFAFYRGSLLLRGSCSLPLLIGVHQRSSVVGIHQCWSVATSLVVAFLLLSTSSFSRNSGRRPYTASGLAIFVSGRYDSSLAPSRYPSLCFFGCRAAGERAAGWRGWRVLGRRRD
jgi:hypothetical protein